jgi:hypothetical protein
MRSAHRSARFWEHEGQSPLDLQLNGTIRSVFELQVGTKLKYRRREITDDDLTCFPDLIARHPTLSRRSLSSELCKAWD